MLHSAGSLNVQAFRPKLINRPEHRLEREAKVLKQIRLGGLLEVGALSRGVVLACIS